MGDVRKLPAYQSKYMTVAEAEALAGQPLTIKECLLGKVRNADDKIVLGFFGGGIKPLRCNKTTVNHYLVPAFGPLTEDWVGKDIEVCIVDCPKNTKLNPQGKCIVGKPFKAAASAPTAEDLRLPPGAARELEAGA